MDSKKNTTFIQKSSLDGGLLQSFEWKKFQESVGRNTFHFENDYFSASIAEHYLPIVGKYFYVPRGPVAEISNLKSQISNKSQFVTLNDQIKLGMQKLVEAAKENNAGWIRIEPANEDILELIKKNVSEKVVRAPHDMQPKEIFLLDVGKPAEQLLREMKSKTRYNIGVAKKKKVIISSYSGNQSEKSVDDFLSLTKEMALRNGISAHPEEYYRKMIESLPEEIIKIYVAEYDGKIVAANLVLFYGKFATYLHGASGNEHRNVMAPFLLQWQAILDAKERGCEFYDFGGVQSQGSNHKMHSDLVGVTNFKLGFSTKTKTIEFPGSYDIIINLRSYVVYRVLQRAKSFLVKLRS